MFLFYPDVAFCQDGFFGQSLTAVLNLFQHLFLESFAFGSGQTASDCVFVSREIEVSISIIADFRKKINPMRGDFYFFLVVCWVDVSV